MSLSVCDVAEEPTPIAPPECPICNKMPCLRLGSLAHAPRSERDAWHIGACVAVYTSTWPRERKLIWKWCHTRGLLFEGDKVIDFDRRREHVPVPNDRRRRR